MKLLNSIFFVVLFFLLGVQTPKYVQAFPVQKEKEKPIKIGLLVSKSNSLEAKYGAEMAIVDFNKNRKENNPSFQLITRSMEGPWGTGSKEAVNLVFNEKVWAILGSHNGRNAHLVEQVIAKTHVVFVSAWAADQSLSQAFVPWYFSCVPNNQQQSSLLINEIYSHQKSGKVVVISDDEYDSENALNSFIKALKAKSIPEPIQIFYSNSNLNYETLVNQINQTNCAAVILLGQSEASIKIIKMMRQKKMTQKIYGSLSVLSENESTHFNLIDYENVVLVNPGYWTNGKGNNFSKSFENKYGWKPGPVAAFAYDGITGIVEAIEKSNFNKEKLQQTLSEIEFDGLTGNISFDKNGNSKELSGLVEIKNGSPVLVEK